MESFLGHPIEKKTLTSSLYINSKCAESREIQLFLEIPDFSNDMELWENRSMYRLCKHSDVSACQLQTSSTSLTEAGHPKQPGLKICTVNTIDEKNSFIFTCHVKNVLFYDCKLAKVVLHLTLKEFFKQFANNSKLTIVVHKIVSADLEIWLTHFS